jgi:very-long-chain (3R)-3-hydroxyacyl-CoA dehydratase
MATVAADATASDSQSISPQAQTASKTSLKTKYLITYNLVSAGLWVAVLHRVVVVGALQKNPEGLYSVVGVWARWIQTLALLEIVHSIFGACHSLIPAN